MFEHGRDVLCGEAAADRDVETLTRIEILHGQRAESATVGELVRDKVHAPNVVPRDRRPPLFAVHRGGVPPRTLATQRRTFLHVHAVEPAND